MGRTPPIVRTNQTTTAGTTGAGVGGLTSPMVFATLAPQDVLEAVQTSHDEGQTLDFSNRNLVDVGELGAEELARVRRGGDESEDESAVQRYVSTDGGKSFLVMFLKQICFCMQASTTWQ